MKKTINVILICVFISLLISGCATAPLKNQPQQIMQHFKQYGRVTINAMKFNWTETDITVQKNDRLIFLVSGKVFLSSWSPLTRNAIPSSCLFYAIDDKNQGFAIRYGYSAVNEIRASGRLKLAIIEGSYLSDKNPQRYKNNQGGFTVDLFVYEKSKEEKVPDLLKELARQNSEDQVFNTRVEKINKDFEILFAEQQTEKEIAETQKEIVKIAEKMNSEDKAEISTAKDDIEIMKDKLAQLTQQLEQLGNLKKEFKAKELREKDLLAKLETARQRPPIVFIGSPRTGLAMEFKRINLYGVIEDDKAIETIEFFINGELNEAISKRGILISQQAKPKRIEFNEKIVLMNGKNTLLVKAIDSDGFTTEKEVVVSYTESRKNVWAVVIGIDTYQKVRHLKYAAKDATAFYRYLIEKIRIPQENVSLLLNEQAHLYKIRSLLGTHLKRKAGKDDMVMIFFAGHGATEKDALSPDGDGLEKYILPYDADLKNLYASALPMSEISKIFNRIYSERLIFIADACYSGASGGRTIGVPGMRTNISDAFMDRISSGKGRVIITASGANEVSTENDDLKHGVFTYYLLEGLKGSADLDKDGIITVDEAYSYVSTNVPLATDQAQHPVKKGSVEGQLIMGVVE